MVVAVVAVVSFWDSLIILVVGGLGMAVPVQAGFGAFHYAVSRVLVVIHGVSLEDGLTYALISHESQIIFEIIVGIISIYVMYGRHRKDPQTPPPVAGQTLKGG